MKKIIKNPYILSILAYLAIMYQLDMFNTNGFKFMYLLGFIGILVVFKNFDFEKVEKRLKIYSLSTSTIFSILLIIGRTVMKYEFNPMSNLFTLKSILFNIIFIICLIPFLYVCFIYLIRFIGNIKLSKTKSIKSKKFALISFIIMCLGKIPYLLAFFPALMTIDSFNVINLYESGTLFNNHPIVYTYFFGTIYKIGKIIFGSGTLGIFFFTIFQVVVIAIILTWLLNYLNNKGVNKYIIYLLLLYYSFSPDFGYMSMTLWKDVLFGISFIPFILSITKMAESDVVNKKINIKYIIIFILSSFAILFFRHNGIYVYIISSIAIFFLFKKNRKILTILSVSLIASFYIVTGPIYNLLNVTAGKTTESYSVLLQQVGRVYLKGGKIDSKSDKYFRNLIDVDSIEEKYLTWIADPMKGLTDTEKLSNSQSEFFKCWFKTFLNNPTIYVESFLSSSVGYWYPDVVYVSVREGGNGVGGYYDITKHDIHKKSLLPEKMVNLIHKSTLKNIPLSIIIWSLGLSFLILILSFIISLYYKVKKQYLFIYFPLIALWLTNVIAAPVYCEYRYMFGLVVSNVLLISIPIFYSNRKKGEVNESVSNNTSL